MKKVLDFIVYSVVACFVVDALAFKYFDVDILGMLGNTAVSDEEVQICDAAKNLEDGVILDNEVNEEGTVITLVEVEAQFNAIGELVTVSRDYKGVEFYEDVADLFGWTLPGTSSSMDMPYSGVIKAGYQLSDITLDLQDKCIIVTLPKPCIISNELEVGDCDYDSAIFNPIPEDELLVLIKRAKRHECNAAIDTGLYAEADANVRTVITDAFADFIECGYTVEFRDAFDANK